MSSQQNYFYPFFFFFTYFLPRKYLVMDECLLLQTRRKPLLLSWIIFPSSASNYPLETPLSSSTHPGLLFLPSFLLPPPPPQTQWMSWGTKRSGWKGFNFFQVKIAVTFTMRFSVCGWVLFQSDLQMDRVSVSLYDIGNDFNCIDKTGYLLIHLI